MSAQPPGRAPRYRVVVYELDRDTQTKVMDTTADAFIAAAASDDHDDIAIALGDGGSRHLQRHIAQLIKSQYRA
jgi:hypothetical protein